MSDIARYETLTEIAKAFGTKIAADPTGLFAHCNNRRTLSVWPKRDQQFCKRAQRERNIISYGERPDLLIEPRVRTTGLPVAECFPSPSGTIAAWGYMRSPAGTVPGQTVLPVSPSTPSIARADRAFDRRGSRRGCRWKLEGHDASNQVSISEPKGQVS